MNLDREPDPIFGTEVERALGAIPRNASALEVALFLRSELDEPELARRAAELHELRARAKRRLGDDRLGFLTRKGVEQASALPVARSRARRIASRAGAGIVLDATCGVGSDALALLDAGLACVAADRDWTALRCARANLVRAGHAGRVVLADALRPAVRAEWLVADPDRRAGGARSRDPERASPPLGRLLAVARRFRGACVKLPPAFDPGPLEGELEGASWQWVSSGGELAEVALWLGELAGPARREALALGPRGEESRLSGPLATVAPLEPDAARRVAWLAEPDPAVIRSGLVGRLAADVGMAPLAPGIAYLGGDARPSSPLLRAWRVLGTAPLDRRRVRELLRQHDVGPLTVKKRGHPDPAAALERRLRGPGSRRGLLAVTRLERGHLALLLAAGPRVGDEGLEPPTSSS